MATRDEKCHAIIHSAAVAAGGIGAGLAQIPGGDIIPITGIQITMIISLGGVFDKELSKDQASNILKALGTGMVGKGIARQLVGLVPFWGNALKSGTAFTLTETLGWDVVRKFEEEEKEKERREKKGFEYGMKEGEKQTKEKLKEKILAETENTGFKYGMK